MSNIKILHPEVPYDEEFSAVWPYRETFFGEKINNSAKCPTISHSNFRRSGTRRRTPSCWWSGTRTRCCAGTPGGCGTSQPTGPGSPRWPGSSRGSAGPGLSRDARDTAGLAPEADRGKVRHEQAAPARPPADGPEHRPPDRTTGQIDRA